jgi:hypothetical protein
MSALLQRKAEIRAVCRCPVKPLAAPSVSETLPAFRIFEPDRARKIPPSSKRSVPFCSLLPDIVSTKVTD